MIISVICTLGQLLVVYLQRREIMRLDARNLELARELSDLLATRSSPYRVSP